MPAPPARTAPRAKRRSIGALELEAMLRTAERVLIETKLDGLNTNAIAKAGPHSVGSVHNHLGSRGEIIETLMTRRRVRLEWGLPAAETAVGDRFGYLKAVVAVVLTTYAEAFELTRLLDLEEQRLGPNGPVGFRGGLRKALREGLFGPRMPQINDPELASAYLCSIIMSMSHDALELRRDSRGLQTARILAVANEVLALKSWSGLPQRG